MSITTIEPTQAETNFSSLPLTGEKKPRFKVMGLVLLIVFILMGNYFLFHRQATDAQTIKKEETFDTSYLNPVSELPKGTSAAEVLSTSVPASAQSDSLSQATPPTAAPSAQEMEKALAEAKAKDFIERVQASQHGGGNNLNTSMTYGNSTAAFNGDHYSTNFTNSNSGNGNSSLDDNSNAGQQNNGISAAMAERIEDPNTAFLVAASNSKAERSYATHYGNLPFVIGQGKFIFANLSVAINSDLPGQISAIVSQDVYGEQGRRILIPKGSLLIGEYKSGLANNQSRLFVVWTRLREPNGIDIQLGSGGTDALGRAGLTGNVDYHFLARFGTASLIALIGAGTANIGVASSDQFNSAADYRQQVASALAQQATNTLNQSINIPPTINVVQGEKIVVFVNKDLDFSRVYR